MKALIKYLPVKGKIEAGNKVISNKNNKIYEVEGKGDDLIICGVILNKKEVFQNVRKVQLFAVTQDFPEYDEVEWGYTKEHEKDNYYFEGGKGWYKILGEVFDEASKFIKDGKEYEVKPYTDSGDTYFRVKCPCCGTFK